MSFTKKINGLKQPVISIGARSSPSSGKTGTFFGSINWRSATPKLLVLSVIFTLSVGFAKAQCSLTIPHVTTSGCYSVSGTSKATVSVEVAWQNPPANGYIVVTTGALSRTITPGVITVSYGGGGTTTPSGSQTIVSPQVVAFEVDANSASGAINAHFSNSTSCSATASYTAPAPCQPILCQSGGLGGQVFNDYNANGVKEAAETNGVGGITVTVFPCIGSPVSTTTDAYGNWSTSASLAYPVRVEFTNLPAAYLGSSTLQGSGSRTTVQFVAASQCNVNLGVNDPIDYCQDNPLLVLPTYSSGDPLVSGAAGSYRGLIGFPYNTGGTNLSFPMTFTIPASAVGTLWAQAYSKITKRLFSAATLKRHAGLGPGGIDAIYITNLTNQASPPTPTYFKLSTLGINVGTVPTNSTRGLVGDKTLQSSDPQAFSLIGTVGIGGMSLSSDGQTLYLMNISNSSLYALDLSTYNTTLNQADITLKGGPYAVPSLGCTNGVQRSWAVKFSKGKVYVGTVCNALSGTKSDLRAGIFAFDPSTNAFNNQPIFDFPLTYPKGYPEIQTPSITGWFPWSNTFSDFVTTGTFGSGSSLSTNVIRPQPILSDIEFDIDGSMILALSDRAGLQTGFRNYNLTGSGDYSGRVGGDLLRAFSRQGTFVLENAAKAGPFVGSRPKNNQGPGFGEFYVDDSGAGDTGSNLYHTEIGLGALALRPGSGEVVAGVMDPTGLNTDYPFTAFSGGVRHMDNTTGLVNDAFALYSSPTTNTRDGTFGKATGIGDLELLCSEQQLIEIGNRVWLDDDKDGIQDACEPILAGVTVSLYKSGTLIATTITNANGEYYFSSKSKLTTGTWSATGADTTLRPTTAYQLLFGNGQFASNILTINNGNYALTTANSVASTASDLNDSDAQIATVAGLTAPVVSLTTGAYGVINHTLDVGFVCLPTTAGSISTTLATCNIGIGTAQSNGRITVTNIQNANRAFLVTTSTIPSYTATSSQPISASAVSFTGLSNPTSTTGTTYNVVLYNGPYCYTVISTTLAQASCCILQGVTAVPSVCTPATNLYSVSGTVSLTNSPAQSLTISSGTAIQLVDVSAGQSSVSYSLTGLTSGTGSHIVTVASSATTSCGNSVSATYTAPASCSIGLTITVSPGLCQTATNGYSVTGTITLTNAVSSTATITDGTVSTTVAVNAGATSVPYTLTGLASGTNLHIVTVSYVGKTASVTYSAPASCTIAVALSVSPGICQPATNQYSISGALSLTNAIAGTATITDGAMTTTVSVSAGATSLPYSLTGLNSGTGLHTVSVSYVGKTASLTYTAPVSCTLGSALVITPGSCQSATNQYTLTGTLSLTNAQAGVATFTDGAVSTTVAVGAGQSSVPFSLTGLISGTASHTLTALFNGQTQTQTYSAPSSCTVAVALSVTPGICQSATNQYSISGTLSLTNAVAGTATITDGAITTTVSVSAGATSLPYSLTGLNSGTGLHTVTVSYVGKTASLTYTAPASCTIAIALSVTPGVCQPATNQYSISGTLSLTNAIAGMATITDGIATTTVSVSAGATSVPYLLSGLNSGTGSHTITVSYVGKTVSLTYTAPISCTLGSALVTTPGSCQSATNQYTLTGTLSLTNAQAGIATFTDGAASTTVAVTAGQSSVPFSLTGLISGTASHTLTALFNGQTQTQTYSAPSSCTVAVALSVNTGVCQSATNQYSISGTLSLTNAIAGTATITDGTATSTVSVSAGATSVSYLLNGLNSGTGSHTVTVSYVGKTATVTYSAPETCITQLTLTKRVSQSVATVGSVLTYTVILTNTGSISATTTVRDSLSTGATYLPGSFSAPAGTTFTAGLPVSLWIVPSISAGQSLTLTFQVQVDSTGILYNTASIPGDTSRVCTSIPIKLCPGDEYALTAPAGRAAYRWYRDGQLIAGATTNVLSVTAGGSYSLDIDNIANCPDFSCCPLIIEVDSLPSFQAVANPATCLGSSAQSNAKLVISGFKSTHTYQYSAGASFNPTASLSGSAKAIPVTGILASNLANPVNAQSYTVRVYNQSGCYIDQTVTLIPTICDCPVEVCVPYVIQQTKRPRRIGDPIN
ncbi:DUF11 domain-containing protein [Spirosoma sp. HMF4905]|uniref:DUF11 domain-containing protein n=1 Tax=Spirosoma arboris TaxID=2682092 RepID=A0A7K1SBF1_9BACT|nr:SdrD B-like domain-containing protein [Spirosoma arboris]MVM31101.1 DUF11 domain-containing protein [Spirosoma arboris]